MLVTRNYTPPFANLTVFRSLTVFSAHTTKKARRWRNLGIPFILRQRYANFSSTFSFSSEQPSKKKLATSYKLIWLEYSRKLLKFTSAQRTLFSKVIDHFHGFTPCGRTYLIYISYRIFTSLQCAEKFFYVRGQWFSHTRVNEILKIQIPLKLFKSFDHFLDVLQSYANAKSSWPGREKCN